MKYSNEPAHDSAHDPAALSYLEMRRYVGYIALGLPFALSGGNALLSLIGPAHALPDPAMEPSISAYYYTVAGRFLVGGLCAIAMFLMSCRGYDRKDAIAGYVASACALGVAFFPTTNPSQQDPGKLADEIGTAHLVFASLMFLTLAYFCLFLFRKTAADRRPTPQKMQRNKVYSFCGWTIVGCIVVMLSLNVGAIKAFLLPIDPLFSFESIALLAFGFAWLTKGGGFLKDK